MSSVFISPAVAKKIKAAVDKMMQQPVNPRALTTKVVKVRNLDVNDSREAK